MQLLLVILLGLIQGLTEFIPISSTAHMTIYGHLSGMLDPNRPEQWTAIIAVVQLGTLLAVLAYFARDIGAIGSDMIRQTLHDRRFPHRQSGEARLGWLVVVGSVPIGAAGLLLRKVIEGSTTKNPLLIAAMLAAIAIVMLVVERKSSEQRSIETLTVGDAIAIGIAQALALLPGASRSATTISAGLLLGLERATAARFSFLLSIPALLASGVLELASALRTLSSQQLWELAIATLVAALSGYASIAFLLHYLRSHRLDMFAYYRLLLAGAIAVLVGVGWLQ
ncbi:MAG: undecaprenyl-diphosphatase UppP [Chlorobi bacterium]|nr:undecaprenyl-diphosphatase UppP [Chlorobiota bacterium]